MQVQLLHPLHLDVAFRIIESCKKSLQSEHILQWTETYPAIETVSNDINNGNLYGLFDNLICLGIITLNTISDAQYQSIPWQDSQGNILILDRLAVDPAYQKLGFGIKLIAFAEEYALGNNFSSIRLDAYSGNHRGIKFYESLKYIKRGEVFFPGRDLPFFCYEKRF